MLHDFRYADAARYRNIGEPQIVRFLCSPFELAAGRAEAETRAMQALLNHLCAIGLPFRQDKDGVRRFDLAEVVNFIKYAHHAFAEPVWLERGVATMRRLCLSEDAGTAPLLPPNDLGGRTKEYAVTITRRFAPGTLRPGAVLRLNMPKPLNAAPGSHRLQWLRTDGAVQVPVDEGARYCVKVRLERPGDTVISLRHQFLPSSGLALSEPPGRDKERYLRPHEGLVVVTPKVLALAQQLGLDAQAPQQSLRRIWDFLFDEISFGFIQYARLAPEDPLLWGLENRRVDCRTGSALIVALCRAAGIPARMVSGYTLHPALATSHTWVEAWIEDEGWRPFDSYAVDLAGDQRDSPWRDHFFGRIDQRFVAEVLPLHFCGLGALRLPPAWQLSTALTEEGATTWFHDVETFAVVYSESVAVRRVDAASKTKASPLRPATFTPPKSNAASPRLRESS